MRNEEKTTTKTVVNVGYCESTSEWINRIMKERILLIYLFCVPNLNSYI